MTGRRRNCSLFRLPSRSFSVSMAVSLSLYITITSPVLAADARSQAIVQYLLHHRWCVTSIQGNVVHCIKKRAERNWIGLDRWARICNIFFQKKKMSPLLLVMDPIFGDELSEFTYTPDALSINRTAHNSVYLFSSAIFNSIEYWIAATSVPKQQSPRAPSVDWKSLEPNAEWRTRYINFVFI